jgi:hypothetical protein
MQASAAGFALTYVMTLKLQLVNWMFIGLTDAKFKPLVFPLHGPLISCIFGFAWYRLTSACVLHNLVAEVEVMTNGQSASLGISLPSGEDDQIFVFCMTTAGFLMWDALCSNNCFCSLPEQSLSGPSPAELITIFYCLIWDSPTGGPGPCIHIPQEQGGPVISQDTGLPFCCLLTTRRAMVEVCVLHNLVIYN